MGMYLTVAASSNPGQTMAPATLPYAFSNLAIRVASGDSFEATRTGFDVFLMKRTAVPIDGFDNSFKTTPKITPACLAAMFPKMEGYGDVYLMSAAPSHLKNALEHNLARQARRPVIGGVLDPNSEEIERQKAFETLHQKRDYYTPKKFERSGKLYELVGIRYFHWFVRNVVGQLKLRIDARAERKENPDFKPDDFAELPSSYRIGFGRNPSLTRKDGTEVRRRRLDELRDFCKETKMNERPHVMAAIFATPLVLLLVAGKAIFDTVSFCAAIFWIANLYAVFLQRYHRARILNTIDLKLARGPFEGVSRQTLPEKSSQGALATAPRKQT